MVKQSHTTDTYAIYNADCMDVLAEMPANSIDLSIYSPPFAGLYNYSSHEADFSNCDSKEQFLEQYEFLVAEMARVTKPGRINAVHCTDVHDNDGKLWDFPHEIIALHEKHGFEFCNRTLVWKEPLKVRMRTMVKSLMHKLIVEDATRCFTAMPDYVLIFKRKGQNAVPVEHPFGLTHYAGMRPLLPEHLPKYGLPKEVLIEYLQSFEHVDDAYDAYIAASFEALRKKYEGHTDPATNKFSHIVWQRYASSEWTDVRINNVLPFKDSKDPDDEKHVHPLQLDVIDRLVDLYSNPGETVFTPFMGVGSEVFSPVSMGRRAIGVELKESYYKQATLNVAEAESRFMASKPKTLFDEMALAEDCEL